MAVGIFKYFMTFLTLFGIHVLSVKSFKLNRLKTSLLCRQDGMGRPRWWRLQQKTSLDLVEEVKTLKLQNTEKDKWMPFLENWVSNLEQHTRLNDVIIAGLCVRPHSCALAVTAEADGITKPCHPLARKGNNDKSDIIMRFVNTEHKTELLKQGKKLKRSDIYINKHRTKWNIARKAQILKKQGKMDLKLNGTPKETKTLVIWDIQQALQLKWPCRSFVHATKYNPSEHFQVVCNRATNGDRRNATYI